MRRQNTERKIAMHRSQPLDLSKEQLTKLGIVEETEEQKAAGRQVVKVETVDGMFDLGFKPTIFDRALQPFQRVKKMIEDTKRSVTNHFLWRKQLSEYYPWDIQAFLPMFTRHLELYVNVEQKSGHSTQEWREYKISTAQETIDILKRLTKDNYSSVYTDVINERWGKFPYEKTTYANGSVGFRHLTPEGYNEEIRIAYEKARADEEKDLKRLGEIVEQHMLDWWD